MSAGRRLRSAVVAALALLGMGCSDDEQPIRFPPVVVTSDWRLAPVVVQAAGRGWWKDARGPVRHDDPVPVGITMYCLKGTTRRGRYVRPGIIAADPRFFPLAQYVELYAGRTYLGRFLVDDTGKKIRGARIDVWTASCSEARRFGLQRGTAVRVRRPPEVQQAAARGQRPLGREITGRSGSPFAFPGGINNTRPASCHPSALISSDSSS